MKKIVAFIYIVTVTIPGLIASDNPSLDKETLYKLSLRSILDECRSLTSKDLKRSQEKAITSLWKKYLATNDCQQLLADVDLYCARKMILGRHASAIKAAVKRGSSRPDYTPHRRGTQGHATMKTAYELISKQNRRIMRGGYTTLDGTVVARARLKIDSCIKASRKYRHGSLGKLKPRKQTTNIKFLDLDTLDAAIPLHAQ